jgi:hypothetical protein
MTMDVDRLRRWVRNDLSPTERREVTRWLVRTADPRVHVALASLVEQHADELADVTLAEKGPLWAELVSRRARLLDDGHLVLADGAVALAFAPSGRAEVGLEFEARRVVAWWDLPMAPSVWFTDDSGAAARLAAGGSAVGRVAMPSGGARPMAWWVWGAPAPVTADALADLCEALRAPEASARFGRWDAVDV